MNQPMNWIEELEQLSMKATPGWERVGQRKRLAEAAVDALPRLLAAARLAEDVRGCKENGHDTYALIAPAVDAYIDASTPRPGKEGG